MHHILPSIDAGVFRLAPGFRAISISVAATPILDPSPATLALQQACKAVLTANVPWAEAHLQAWADLFRAFGAKPQRTPCSAEALRKRVIRDGTLPSIDPVVDLYNAISIRYAIPVGGENSAAYVGMPRLAIAIGNERFDTLKNGELANEPPEAGEVVWRDDEGVTCRRWNWRQGIRTRLDSKAEHMWFILESLPAMPLDALHAAEAALIQGLKDLMPGAEIHSELIAAD